jgi:hypothetical protein
MKQGRPSRDVRESGHPDPKSHAVSVDKVANIGLQIVRTNPPSKDLYSGRGFEAPAMKTREFNKGSQGKY